MFTGIIQNYGKVSSLKDTVGDKQIAITANLDELGDIQLGTSIAVNGVCLTVIDFNSAGFSADVSLETLDKSNLQGLSLGAEVNLESALTLNTALSGHLVMGHVDGVGSIKKIISAARSQQLLIEIPNELRQYIAKKGSICIDGVSLTVNNVHDNMASINIVPHTFNATIIRAYKAGTKINIEVDIIARYLERLLQAGNNTGNESEARVTQALLEKHGFIK